MFCSTFCGLVQCTLTDFCRFSVTFKVKNSGLRILDNGKEKQYYTDNEATRKIELRVDTYIPYHCREKMHSTDPSSTMLTVLNDFTKATTPLL